MEKDMEKMPELFGSMVFNEETMKEELSEASFTAWKECVTEGKTLDLSTANEIAEAMKQWAVAKGATHYTHWFQPMTGATAEKHDSFIHPTDGGKIIMEFSGKELVKGEPDASSFPSGGLRSTFEARGYTAWDPTSFAFVKEGSLYIPTIFCSYSGEALDKKMPLLRSMEVVSNSAVRILRLFGDTETKRVTAQVGPEQEYFLIDKKLYNEREDLRLAGRTLFGAKPPRGQEMEDHYFGMIKPRVSAFMEDLDRELWKVGVLSKTKHNEVAPSQHEMAPIYSDANTACDHNQLAMELMKKVADRHGFVCLIHEKPFEYVNGSGKHDNWSLSTDQGENLFKPGKTPSKNARFLLFLAAFVKGVDEYQDFLRATVASAGNDHRLGAQEAPPAIISIFLGQELESIVDSIISETDYTERSKGALRIGVDVLPPIPQDTTDRNRTSPVAFTGNKFEFRMPGSSQSIAGPATILNTIMADSLSEFADELEGIADPEKFNEALHELIKKTFTEHKRIIFGGNGYDASWVTEAEKRGLSNLVSSAEALLAYNSPKNIELLTKHGVYTAAEIASRHEIHLEQYCKVINIEATTLVDMVQHGILNAVSKNVAALCKTIKLKKDTLPEAPCRLESALAGTLSALNESLLDKTVELKSALETVPDADSEKLIVYYHEKVFRKMQEVREVIDKLETLTATEYWPYPSYCDMLFSV